jgi:hypothetical protein
MDTFWKSPQHPRPRLRRRRHPRAHHGQPPSPPTGRHPGEVRVRVKGRNVDSGTVGRRIDTDDVIDAERLADLLGLSQRNEISLFQRGYPTMPRPAIDLGQARCKLWLRSEVDECHFKRLDRAGPT